ncbi:unnamed protein product [Rhodiola kirilowii]
MVRFSAKDCAAEGESSSRGRKRTRVVSEVREDDDDDEADDDGNDEVENGEAAGVDERADVSEDVDTMDGLTAVFLTDSDVLDCVICYESLKIPVFQCENGHIACDSCCTKLNNKCPSCSFPIGYNRNRAIEKVIESMKVLCRNSKHGCRERLDFNGRKEHEDNCIYSPYRCPIHCCGVIGSFQQLWRHIPDRHSTIVKRFQYNRSLTILLDKNSKFIVLKEEKEGALFILNNSPDYSGNKITVNSIGPILSKTVLSYDLMAIRDIDTLRLLSLVKNHFAQVGGSSSFLIVPHAFFDSNRQLKMELCIRLTNLQ